MIQTKDLGVVVRRLSLQPGDLLIYKTDLKMSAAQVERIVDQLDSLDLPEGVRTVVLDEGGDLLAYNDVTLGRLGLKRTR